MPLPDQALWFYRQMTARNRRRLLDRLCEDHGLPISILFYHRVAQRDFNPWSISFDDFRHHLDWLQSNFQLVTLSEAQERIRQGDNDRHCVAITFDDGYADNTQFAIPELVSRRIPMTYFVTTHFVESGKPFPHDLALGRPLEPNTVAELRRYVDQGIEIGAHTRSHCDIGTVTSPSQLWDEIAGSIQTLRQWLDIPCSLTSRVFVADTVR
jgi:peptidoglycan/xylan/chitin deacetylase (PgdA/CDA1 family)